MPPRAKAAPEPVKTPRSRAKTTPQPKPPAKTPAKSTPAKTTTSRAKTPPATAPAPRAATKPRTPRTTTKASTPTTKPRTVRLKPGQFRMLTVTASNGTPTNYPQYTTHRYDGMVLVIEGVPKAEVEVWNGVEYRVESGQTITIPLHLITRVVERVCTPVVTSRSRTRSPRA